MNNTKPIKATRRALAEPFISDASDARSVRNRPIGALIREVCELSDQQIDDIAAYQRKNGVRFGEAAVALRLASRQEVLEALSRQFEYTPGFAGRELSRELVAAADPFSDQAEAFRELRSRLLLEVMTPGAPRAFAVVSPDSGDGKTYTAANLAIAFSQLAERTLLVDGDIRTPRQHRLFEVPYATGLSSVLARRAQAADTVQAVPGLSNLYVMPAGPVPPNPLELLQRPGLDALMRELLEKYEHVVVDTPAATRGADPRVIAARAGAALVVARRGHSRMAALEKLLAALGRAQTPVAGVVMNEH
jgi:chain length determinant protein tyrosine kinase EpsG